MTEAGIGAGGNVYAELGSTWRRVMGNPDEAAHVVGKLLVAFGPERILWGTDSIWYGSPQDQIAAFRTFEITPAFQEQYGYPALTPDGEAPHPRPQRDRPARHRRPAGDVWAGRRRRTAAERPGLQPDARAGVASRRGGDVRARAPVGGPTNPLRTAGERYRSAHMFVKICGITNEDDALLAVAMGADAVGFVFAPSPRQIAAQQAYDITRRLPPEILTVGVFRDEHPKLVTDIVHRVGGQGGAAARERGTRCRRRGRPGGAVGDQGVPGRIAEGRRGRRDADRPHPARRRRHRDPASSSTGAWPARCPTGSG